MARHPGFNMTLGVDLSGGTSYTNIGQIVDIAGPSMSRNVIELADRSMTTFFIQKLFGMVNPGQLSFDVAWDPITDTTHGQTSGTGILSNFESDGCILPKWQAQLSGCGGTATWVVDGGLSAFDATAPLEDKMGASVVVDISGKPTLTIT